MAGDTEKEFEFPECWKNDIRMTALFAPFRLKSLNPTDWDSKIKFWTNLIENWCKWNKCPVVEISSLKNSFSRKGLAPACLEEVLQHLNSTGVIIKKENFLAPDENWMYWTKRVLVTSPLRWTLNTVKSKFFKAIEQEIHYVHFPVVKHLSEEIQKCVFQSSKKIVNTETLMSLGFGNSENLFIVLHWMQKQGLASIHALNDITLVKIGNSNNKPVNITETDLGFFKLERLVEILKHNVDNLYKERDAALEEVKKHLSAKMKNVAKLSLLRKKKLESKIEERLKMLENVQEILQRIEQSKVEAEVLEGYQQGIAALKQIYKETGLNAENVTDTMNELEKVLADTDEIQKSLAIPIDSAQEDDLEAELNELLLRDAPEVSNSELPSLKEKKKERKVDEMRKQLETLSI